MNQSLKMNRKSTIAGRLVAILMLLAITSSACSSDFLQLPSAASPQPDSSTSTPAPPPPSPEAEITFSVQIPANTPLDEPVLLNVLDEVTGLGLNAETYPMEAVDNLHYRLILPFPVGTIVKYRYSRQGETAPLEEHISDGRQVRYRLYDVQGKGEVQDVVSRWTDTKFEGSTGRIKGEATDADTGQPIPNLLVAAGGAQTLTAADGTFLLEGLPPGTHNLVGYALDGSYHTFQQGATVAADSTTPAPINLNAAKLVNVVFVVSQPEGSIPAVPIRIAGNLFQLGNTFADLSAGLSTVASRMPVLNLLPDGRHTLTLSLPAGADVRYLYTLGDGFWNTELSSDGKPNVRQIIVPNDNTQIDDTIATWHAGGPAPITFDVTVPENTPPDDFVSIQFNPLFSWTEPIPMWRLSPTRWAYVLNSPLGILHDFTYRYCRNDQCGSADDAQTMGMEGPGRPVSVSDTPQTMKDEVKSWAWLDANPNTSLIETPDIPARGQNFMAGVELQPYYNPTYPPLIPKALKDVSGLGGNWIVIPPTWSYTRDNLPVLEPVTGVDPMWSELTGEIEQSRQAGLNVAIFPTPNFPSPAGEWWSGTQRDYAWWLVWFEGYSKFLLNNAALAAKTDAQALILGGDWLEPALPGGTLADGTPSGVPADADTRWRALIADVRQVYKGSILWAIPYKQAMDKPPSFLDAVDQIYLLWSVPLADQGNPSQEEMGAKLASILDNGVITFHAIYNKPLILAVAYPAVDGSATACLPDPNGTCLSVNALSQPNPDMPDLQLNLAAQADVYQALLAAVNQRDWIGGFVSRGYYPPAVLRDKSISVHGKPAQDVLAYWFPRLLGNTAP